MFWNIYQSPDNHKGKEVREVHGRYNYTYFEIDPKYMENPKKGLGRVVVIEADTAREAWDHGIRLGMNRSSGKWSRPREGRKPNWPDIRESNDKPLHATTEYSIYIHFKSGFFFCASGLHKYPIQDLVKIGMHDGDYL